MANQNYMGRFSPAPGAGESVSDPTKTKGGRAVEQGFNGANNPTAGRVKTPAPLRAPPPTPDIARSTSFGRENYGANAYSGASSIEPGTAVRQNGIDIDPPDGDPALKAVIANGMGRKTTIDSSDKLTGQERPISDTEYAPAHGMRHRKASDGSPG